VASGYNSAATGKTVLGGARLGAEWLGFAGAGRDRPVGGDAAVRALSPAQSSAFVGALHNNWTPFSGPGRANGALGASIGGQAQVGGRSVGYVGSLSYAYNQEVRTDELRQLVVGGGAADVRAYNTLRGSTGRESVLWGGVANFSTLIGTRTRLAFNNMYNRSADNEAHQDAGFDESQSVDPTARTSSIRRSWLDFVERTVRSNQLRGEHEIGGAQRLDWTVTSSGVTRRQPDRTDVFTRQDAPGEPSILPIGEPRAARRLYASLTERALAPAANYRVQLGSGARPWTLKLGASYRDTRREASNEPYFFTAPTATDRELAMAPEQLFPTLLSGNRVTVNRDPASGSYEATDRVGAGYGMAEVPLGDRFRLVGGARVESWRLALATTQAVGDAFDSTYATTDVLPSLALNVKLGGDERPQNVRLSASRTLSRPEYRELSPLQERGPIGDLDFVGNPGLRRSLIDNLDARWEMYPNPGEIFSLAVFAKRFDRPIERVQVSTNGGNIYSFVNADRANNYGVELEARKGLGVLGEALRPFSGFTNVTLMKSEITPGNTDVSALTSADRPMVGQAPYVVNAGLAWGNASGSASATALYNVVGRAITSTGTKPTPDTYREARHSLDLSFQLPVTRGVSAKLNARNLLDAPWEETAGGITRLRYRTGRVFSLGFTWNPGAVTEAPRTP
jgi:TonB-dependent receptor